MDLQKLLASGWALERPDLMGHPTGYGADRRALSNIITGPRSGPAPALDGGHYLTVVRHCYYEARAVWRRHGIEGLMLYEYARLDAADDYCYVRANARSEFRRHILYSRSYIFSPFELDVRIALNKRSCTK